MLLSEQMRRAALEAMQGETAGLGLTDDQLLSCIRVHIADERGDASINTMRLAALAGQGDPMEWARRIAERFHGEARTTEPA